MAMNVPPEKRTILGVAAESIVQQTEGTDRPRTVIDVVHGRALQHYSEGLRQYLAISLGDVALANQALVDLRAMATVKGPEEMAKHPGVRARLFRLARDLSGGYKDRTQSAEQLAKLPWLKPPLGASETHLAAIDDIRRNIDAERREILDLHHARELSVEELAFVLDLDPGIAEQRLRAAEDEARLALGAFGNDQELLSRAVLEAFALQKADEPEDLDEEEEGAALMAGTIIGERYKIEKKVGSGAFAQVYLASDTDVPGHHVALKLLHNASLSKWDKERALRELRLIASVFHPSIVQFKDHGWYESRLWFVMPWYDGESLEDRIRREPLSRKDARDIFEPLSRALATMHASSLRHQDVKPDNIFLAKVKRYGVDAQEDEILPVLLDLGVAATDAEMVVAGTPDYFAPEVAAQFASQPSGYTISNKADVFSLALCLRNALEPESEENITAGAIETFIESRAASPPGPPVGKEFAFLREHFERWLNVDPDIRPTAEEFAQELQVLTWPEEKRAKTIAILKWVVPLGLGIAIAVSAALFVLNKQKQFQAARADQAELEALEVREDLGAAEQRGAALEEKLRIEYEQSKLTKKQLGDKLAHAEGRLQTVRSALGSARARITKLDGNLGDAKKQVSRLGASLDATNRTLDSTRRELSSAQSELAQTRDAYQRANQQLAAATQDINEARGQIQALGAANADLEDRLARSERARQDAETALADTQRDNRRLEAEVARLSATVAQLQRANRTAVPTAPSTDFVPVAPPTEQPPASPSPRPRRRR